MFKIYLISNAFSDKKYIGITSTSLTRRYARHLSFARKGSRWLLHAAMRKYGFDSFSVCVLAEVETRDDAVSLERRFIVEHKTRAPFGYNMTDGGDGATGYRHTAEWKAELSRRGKGRKRSPETVEGMRQRMLGWSPTEETRERMRQRQTGRKHAPATIQRMQTAALLRWKVNPRISTPEEQQRLRVLAVGAVRTPAHRKAISDALKGKPKSPETRAKLSAARKAMVQRTKTAAETKPKLE